MDSELQAAFDSIERNFTGQDNAGVPRAAAAADVIVLMKATRKCANPDYEATAVLQHNRNMYEPMWVVWADLSEGDRVNRIKQARVDVDAALGVTDDE